MNAIYYISNRREYRSVPVPGSKAVRVMDVLIEAGYERVRKILRNIPGKGETLEVYWVLTEEQAI